MTHSIKSRFLATLTSSVLRAALNFVTTIALARGLGPLGYGEMVFLLGSFAASRQILDAGTSTAFYTFISQQRRGRQFFFAYFVWLLVQFLIPLGLVSLLFPSSWIEQIWRGYEKTQILGALLVIFLQQQVWQTISQIGESARLNVPVQLLSIAVALAHLLLILLGWHFELLSVSLVFGLISAEYLVAAVVGYHFIAHPVLIESTKNLRSALAEYFMQCRPLVIYGWVGFVYNFLDNWMLNRFAGAQEQAYFSLGNQFALFCLVPTMALLQIYWKEVAEAFGKNEGAKIGRLFERSSRIVYAMTAVICGLLLPWSREIVTKVLGHSYHEGWPTLALMLIYALHISLSQIASTTLQASGDVRWQTRLGIAYMVINVPFSYLVLAPQDSPFPGLGLGAAGMTFKLVVLQFLLVNIMFWRMSQIRGWRVSIWYQGYVIVVTLLPGWLAREIGVVAWGVEGIWALVLSGLTGTIIYVAFLTFVIRARPSWLGLEEVDFGWLKRAIASK